MALPSSSDLKTYLRIQSTAEDTLLASLVTRATALAEGVLGRPITTVADLAMVDEADTLVAYGAVTKLLVPVTPYDTASLVITDADGTALVVTTDYRVGNAWTGEVFASEGSAFTNGPYTLTADVGLATASDYSTRIEPLIGAAIIDIAADLWHRRNPGAATESTGGGVSTTYVRGIPERAWQMLAAFARVRVV